MLCSGLNGRFGFAQRLDGIDEGVDHATIFAKGCLGVFVLEFAHQRGHRPAELAHIVERGRVRDDNSLQHGWRCGLVVGDDDWRLRLRATLLRRGARLAGLRGTIAPRRDCGAVGHLLRQRATLVGVLGVGQITLKR